jgi:hypothetical protein
MQTGVLLAVDRGPHPFGLAAKRFIMMRQPQVDHLMQKGVIDITGEMLVVRP